MEIISIYSHHVCYLGIVLWVVYSSTFSVFLFYLCKVQYIYCFIRGAILPHLSFSQLTDVGVIEVSARSGGCEVVSECHSRHDGTLGEEGHTVVILVIPHVLPVPMNHLGV